MPDTSSLPSSTTEDVEALARFMGWPWIGEGGALPDTFGWSDRNAFFYREHGHIMVGRYARPGLWNPFSDANDDLQVLERVREVWGESMNWTRFVLAFSRPLLDGVKSHDFAPHVAFSIVLGGFAPGCFSRAALAVLREMEKG